MMCVSIPIYDAHADEQGNEGSHRIGSIFAVKKGSVTEGSSGKTSIFCGGTGMEPGVASAGVNLKRATCLMATGLSVLQLPLEYLIGAERRKGRLALVYSNSCVLKRISQPRLLRFPTSVPNRSNKCPFD